MIRQYLSPDQITRSSAKGGVHDLVNKSPSLGKPLLQEPERLIFLFSLYVMCRWCLPEISDFSMKGLAHNVWKINYTLKITNRGLFWKGNRWRKQIPASINRWRWRLSMLSDNVVTCPTQDRVFPSLQLSTQQTGHPPTPPPPKSHRAPPSCFPRTDDTPFSKFSLVIASTWTESPLIKIVLFWPDKRQLLPRFSLVISWGRNCVCHPPARQVAPIIPYMRTKLPSDPKHSASCPETTLSIQARIQKCQHF